MHSRFGYSAVSTFRQCPYRYKLTHIDRLKVLPDYEPTNALVLGTAFHLGMETGEPERALDWYRWQFPVCGDAHETECAKLDAAIKSALPAISPNEGARHEVFIRNGEFMGTIDLLEPTAEPGVWDMVDFKYCAMKNAPRYRDSAQLHIYKRHFERTTGQRIRLMGFICVPKIGIKKRWDEDLYDFRKRVDAEQAKMQPQYIGVEYDPGKVAEFDATVEEIKRTRVFGKNPSRLCDWCEYQKYCEEGTDYMILPSESRREIGTARRRKMWIYGPSFSGKTTMLDGAPDPLNINTDGNIEFVTMPYVSIKDEVVTEGRVTRRTFAWQIFKDTITELEKKQNGFRTIIIDLVEDTREMCRVYMYDKLGIQHESDAGYGKGWDIIKTEYLSTMRRFFNLDYENLVIVSHETASEVKKKSGQSITKIAPNIQEAVANKLAGMVDIVARVVVDDDGARTLNFKSNEYVFGGGRLGLAATTVPLDWDALCEVYEAAAKPKRKEPVLEPATEAEPVPVIAEPIETPPHEEPKRRTRRRREE